MEDFDIIRLTLAILFYISGNRRDLPHLARELFGEETRSLTFRRDERPCFRCGSFELCIGEEIRLYHPFALTTIYENEIVHRDIDGDEQVLELNEENITWAAYEVLFEIN